MREGVAKENLSLQIFTGGMRCGKVICHICQRRPHNRDRKQAEASEEREHSLMSPQEERLRDESRSQNRVVTHMSCDVISCFH